MPRRRQQRRGVPDVRSGLPMTPRLFVTGLDDGGRLSARHDAAALEVAEDLRDALLDGLLAGLERQLGLERGLVGGRDAGELRNLAGPGLRREALRVAPLADVDRAVDQHLDEVTLRHERAHLVAIGTIGRDER